jgi:hypothetical protein
MPADITLGNWLFYEYGWTQFFFCPLPFCLTGDNFVTARKTNEHQTYMSPCKSQTLYHSAISIQFVKYIYIQRSIKTLTRQRLEGTVCTVRFSINKFYILSTECISVFCMNLRTGILSSYSIKWLVFKKEAGRVYCEVRTDWCAGDC